MSYAIYFHARTVAVDPVDYADVQEGDFITTNMGTTYRIDTLRHYVAWKDMGGMRLDFRAPPTDLHAGFTFHDHSPLKYWRTQRPFIDADDPDYVPADAKNIAGPESEDR